MRKSPYRHRVRSHLREVNRRKIPVNEYVRGQGDAPKKAKPAAVRRGYPSIFVSEVEYSGGREVVEVEALDYPEALEKTFNKTQGAEPPKVVRIARRVR